VVTHAAMSKDDGSVYFPRDSKVGVENKGISNADCSEGNASSCISVKMYSLDTYVETFIPKGIPINYLSVDVEGWDFEVLLGGKHDALSRVHYLEFEYNWVRGSCMIECPMRFQYFSCFLESSHASEFFLVDLPSVRSDRGSSNHYLR
jgi:hypothetical protein